MFEALKSDHFYARHYYLFRYIINPTVFSACVCIFYEIPWIPLLVMLTVICHDLVQAWRKVLLKLDLDNQALVVENCLFLLVSVLFAVFLGMGDASRNKHFLGILGIILVVTALASVVFYKIKGKRVL